jgi:hypothetical protein
MDYCNCYRRVSILKMAAETMKQNVILKGIIAMGAPKAGPESDSV